MNRQQAYDLYIQYLTTAWPSFDGALKKPVSAKLLKQMIAVAQDYQTQFNSKPSTLEQALKQGRNVLFWSDTHFFHHNIISYASRPDIDASHMNERLIRNYFDSVGANDIVVWAGDCAFGNAPVAREYLRAKDLPGYKILIMGNHDFEKKSDEWRNMGIFDEVLLCDGFTLELEGVQKDLIFTHYPLPPSLVSDNMINVHGHIHEKNIGYPWVNLSVEAIDYRPQSLEYCIRMAHKYRPSEHKLALLNV